MAYKLKKYVPLDCNQRSANQNNNALYECKYKLVIKAQ